MNASSSFDRALGQPFRAAGALLAVPKTVTLTKPLCAAAPVRARPDPVPARPDVVIVPRRDAPGAKAAPKVHHPVPVLPPVAAPARRAGLRGAALVSTALHLGLVAGWAVFAAPARPLMPPDLEAAEVSLLSEAQFMAMTAPQPQLAMAALPMLAAPPSEGDTPSAKVSADAPPAPAPMAAPAPPPLSALADLAPDPAPKADVPPVVEKAPPAPVAEPAPKVAKAEPAAKPAKPAPAPEKATKPTAKPTAKPATDAPALTAKAAAAPSAAAKPGISAGQAKKLTADWGAKVRARINRKVALPADSAPGTVKVRLELAPSGQLLSVAVAQSSGQATLDAAAIKAVKSAAPFARAPKGLTKASYSFSLPITFKS